MDWQFKREEPVYDEIPVGLHRLRISSAEKAVSKTSGNDMLVLKFEVSNHTTWVFYYIPFLFDRPEITNRMLTALFDSFGIEDGNFNLQSWVGKVGAGMIKHDDQDRPKIGYLVNRKKQEDLPAWVEPKNKTSEPGNGGFTPITADDSEDLPF